MGTCLAGGPVGLNESPSLSGSVRRTEGRRCGDSTWPLLSGAAVVTTTQHLEMKHTTCRRREEKQGSCEDHGAGSVLTADALTPNYQVGKACM